MKIVYPCKEIPLPQVIVNNNYTKTLLAGLPNEPVYAVCLVLYNNSTIAQTRGVKDQLDRVQTATGIPHETVWVVLDNPYEHWLQFFTEQFGRARYYLFAYITVAERNGLTLFTPPVYKNLTHTSATKIKPISSMIVELTPDLGYGLVFSEMGSGYTITSLLACKEWRDKSGLAPIATITAITSYNIQSIFPLAVTDDDGTIQNARVSVPAFNVSSITVSAPIRAAIPLNIGTFNSENSYYTLGSHVITYMEVVEALGYVPAPTEVIDYRRELKIEGVKLLIYDTTDSLDKGIKLKLKLSNTLNKVFEVDVIPPEQITPVVDGTVFIHSKTIDNSSITIREVGYVVRQAIPIADTTKISVNEINFTGAIVPPASVAFDDVFTVDGSTPVPVPLSDITFYLSGGYSNADIDTSIGGAISATTLANNTVIITGLSDRQYAAGAKILRCFYLKNTQAITAAGLHVYVKPDNNAIDLDISLAIGITEINATEPTRNEEGGIEDLRLYRAYTPANGVRLQPMQQDDHIPVWVQVDIEAGDKVQSTQTFTLYIAQRGA